MSQSRGKWNNSKSTWANYSTRTAWSVKRSSVTRTKTISLIPILTQLSKTSTTLTLKSPKPRTTSHISKPTLLRLLLYPKSTKANHCTIKEPPRTKSWKITIRLKILHRLKTSWELESISLRRAEDKWPIYKENLKDWAKWMCNSKMTWSSVEGIWRILPSWIMILWSICKGTRKRTK